MGWCGEATRVFDTVAEFVLKSTATDSEKTAVLKTLIEALEDEDWDCQNDSDYIDHPLVDGIMRELHPDWDWDE